MHGFLSRRELLGWNEEETDTSYGMVMFLPIEVCHRQTYSHKNIVLKKFLVLPKRKLNVDSDSDSGLNESHIETCTI